MLFLWFVCFSFCCVFAVCFEYDGCCVFFLSFRLLVFGCCGCCCVCVLVVLALHYFSVEIQFLDKCCMNPYCV